MEMLKRGWFKVPTLVRRIIIFVIGVAVIITGIKKSATGWSVSCVTAGNSSRCVGASVAPNKSPARTTPKH
jgi:hypothetical protein